MSTLFPNLSVIKHPLIEHKITLLRDKTTPTSSFRKLVDEISKLITYEATRNLPLKTTTVQTPIQLMTDAKTLDGKKMVVVPILRAGLGMSDAIVDLIPSARVGHIGLYRDEKTHLPVQYLVKLPKLNNRYIFVVDPMLATGGSLIKAIDILKENGAEEGKIIAITLLTCPTGVKAMQQAHPNVSIYTAAHDNILNDKDYIVPGLGDAGDRIFGTK